MKDPLPTRRLASPALIGLAIASVGFAASGETRPNVLFIMADDYRAELATYGSAALTPNLTRLARRAVQFDRAYCQQAVCNPSRSSMLTGRRPDTLRLWNKGTHFRELNPDVTTLPLHFKQQGYTTRNVGKIFHNWHTKEKGDARSWSAPEFLHYAPLIWVVPGVTKGGGRCERTVDFMSIYPTLCDLAGLPVPKHVEGKSIRGLLAKPSGEWTLPAVTTHGRNNHAVRTERWRYIRYEDGGEELYDHAADPYEWKNLARDAQFEEVKAELKRWLPKESHPAR
jgi:arylsulfatase A-like enzyme